MIKFNQLLGYYMPAFFKLYIRTLDPIDLRKLTPAELCTFVHEYTHFIQDFTTIKGLQNIYNTFEQLSLFVNETYRTRKLRIPIQAYHPVLSLNQNISDRTWGSHINISNIVSLSKIASKKVDLSQDVLNQHPELNYKIPLSGVISRPAASTSCRSFFIISAGIHFLSTLTVRTRLRLRTISIGANLLLSSAILSRSLKS